MRCLAPQTLPGKGGKVFQLKGFSESQAAALFSHTYFTPLCRVQDELQGAYEKTGLFPGPKTSPPRQLRTLMNWLFWSCVVLYPLGLMLTHVISSGSALTIIAAVVVSSAGQFPKFT